MSLFPDWLFKLTPRDEQVTPLDLVTFWTDYNTGAGATTSLPYTVPDGKVLVLSSAAVRAWPDVAENITYMSISYQDSVGNDIIIMAKDGPGNTGVSLPQVCAPNSVAGQIIPSGAQIVGYALSNGVGDVQLRFSLSGVLIPRGNVAV